MLKDPTVRFALAAWSVPITLLCAATVLTGCATPAPAETFIVADYVEPEPDPAPSLVVDEPTEAAPAESVVVKSADCPCTNCTCDPCECQAMAKAATYRPEQINGAWYCTHNGQRLKWTAVRCYGPDVPCDYEWRPVPSSPVTSQPALSSSPACATGNCGTFAPGRTIRRGRLLGRR